MEKFAAKVLVLLGIIANFILFVVTVVSIIFICISTNALQELSYNILNPVTIAGLIFTIVTIIYSLIISIIASFNLIKGDDFKNVVGNYFAFFPVLIATGVDVFGFGTLVDINFSFFLGIYIATCVLNLLLFASSILINKTRR